MTIVSIRNVQGKSLAVGSAGERTVTIDRARASGGEGLGFSGGELLLLAIGGCYSNDVFREGDRLGIEVRSVEVEVSANWGGSPVRAQDVLMKVKVEADAPEERIRELIAHTDSVAEIPNSLRYGTNVKLVHSHALGA
jgi:uncharacterized OsmC-like protein